MLKKILFPKSRNLVIYARTVIGNGMEIGIDITITKTGNLSFTYAANVIWHFTIEEHRSQNYENQSDNMR